VAGVSILAVPALAAGYFEDPLLTRTLLIAFAGSLVLRLSEYAMSVLRTYQRFRFHAAAGLAATAFLLLGSVVLSVTGQVSVYTIVALLVFWTPAVKLVVSFAGTPGALLSMGRPDARSMRGVLSFGKWVWGTQLLESGVRRVNVLLLQAFAGNVATGYFHMGSRYAEFLALIFQPLRKYLLPKFTALETLAETGRALRRTYAWLAWTLLLIPPAWILAGPVITLAQGPEWLPAVALFRILVVSRLLFLLSKPMTFVLFSLGLPQAQTMLHLLSAGVYLVAAVMLIPAEGATGAAYAMLLFSVTVLLSLAWYVRRRWTGAAA
jgi:O-antigen/teichoic acid export membrane protein